MFLYYFSYDLLFNLTYKALFTHINHHMTSYLSQTWPWCAEMPLHLRNISLVSGWVLPPKKNYFVLFDGIKNVTITDPLYLGPCVWWVMFVPRLGLQSKYFVHVNELTVLTGLHLSHFSNPHITCKVNTCEMIYFCSGSSNLYLDLHRWYWPINWKGTVSVHGVSLSGSISFIIHVVCLYLSNTDYNVLLDNNHTMGYWVFVSGKHLCAPDSEWGFLLNLLFQSTMDLNDHWLCYHTQILSPCDLRIYVSGIWVNYLFDYTMTNKLIFIHQILVHSCVPMM